ncbi:hypothetical protein PRIPAC_92909 [Pristionchus pacificus]|nr:hypothetical protein PRIPAC_92909 [Pristionchus pacificus]
MRGVGVLVPLLLLLMSACSAPIRNRREAIENTEPEPATTTRPPPLLPPGNRHGILIWMCQNDDVLHIIDEVKQLDDFDVTNVANLTKEIYTRLIDYKPGRLWTVYSTIFTTRSTANLITEDGTTISPSICFVQFNENPQILVVADLAEVV